MTFREEIIGDCRLVWIYALCEPGGENPRYVGKTVRGLNPRHKGHLYDAKRRNLPVHRWIRKQHKRGSWTCIRALEIVAADGDWAAREKFWIKRLREQGHDLLNITEGGDGHAGRVKSEDERQRIAAGLRTGAHFNCEVCGAQFWRKQYAIKRAENRFCSRPCYSASLKGVSRTMPATCTERGVKAAAAAKLARLTCINGHLWTDETTRKNSRGARVCRVCEREAKRRYQERYRD